jgi:hypothetical protein
MSELTNDEWGSLKRDEFAKAAADLLSDANHLNFSCGGWDVKMTTDGVEMIQLPYLNTDATKNMRTIAFDFHNESDEQAVLGLSRVMDIVAQFLMRHE